MSSAEARSLSNTQALPAYLRTSLIPCREFASKHERMLVLAAGGPQRTEMDICSGEGVHSHKQQLLRDGITVFYGTTKAPGEALVTKK